MDCSPRQTTGLLGGFRLSASSKTLNGPPVGPPFRSRLGPCGRLGGRISKHGLPEMGPFSQVGLHIGVKTPGVSIKKHVVQNKCVQECASHPRKVVRCKKCIYLLSRPFFRWASVLFVFVVLSVFVESAMLCQVRVDDVFLRCVLDRHDVVCHVCATRKTRLWRQRKLLACGPKHCPLSRTSNGSLSTFCATRRVKSARSSAGLVGVGLCLRERSGSCRLKLDCAV